MDKSNTVKDSQKKLLHFFSSSLEGWLTKVSTQVRKTRVRYANNAKHHNFIPFISPFTFQQTFPGNRHAGATTVNYTILWFLKRRRPDPQTCVISQVSQAWESIKKERKSRERNRLGDGYQAAPDCWGRRCSTVQELLPTAVAWQTCCVGTRIEMGVTAEGNPTTKAFIVNTLKVVKTK